MIKNITKLSNLKEGKCATITDIEIKGDMRRRLIDLGFAKGSVTWCMGNAPLGDPKAFYIKGSVIALREEDSKFIKISEH